jgi:hypothetical protein
VPRYPESERSHFSPKVDVFAANMSGNDAYDLADFKELINEFSKYDKDGLKDLLVDLAEVYDGEKLQTLTQRYPWLQSSIASHRDEFEEAQHEFMIDSSRSIKALEEFTDLYWKDLVNRSIACSLFGTIYTFFCAEIMKRRDNAMITVTKAQGVQASSAETSERTLENLIWCQQNARYSDDKWDQKCVERTRMLLSPGSAAPETKVSIRYEFQSKSSKSAC